MKQQEKQKKPGAPISHLQTGTIVDVGISALNSDGLGEATHDGTRILVRGALPGEQARIRITFAGKRDCFANVIKLLRHSPKRLAGPTCNRLDSCDGCPVMLMKYPAQLLWKHELVKEALFSYPALKQLQLFDPLPSPKPLHYRNSAKLVVTGKHGAPVIGIYRRNSHDVLDISDCPLHHPLINRIIIAVREGIGKGKVPVYSERTGNGLLRYLVVRVSESENRAMVVFVTSQRSFNEIHHLAKYLQSKVAEVQVIAQNINSSKGNVILGEKYHFLTRERFLPAKIDETRFAISPSSFFQINSGSAGIIYGKVREWANLTGIEEVVDLYCGIGGISLFLASKAKSIIGIEVVPAAVHDAEMNARLNGLENCEFIAGDAGELLQELRLEGKKIDLMVLNPPRKGCEAAVLKKVTALEPGRIIYVSCSPLTLARDLDQLSREGYHSVAVQPVDMFPQTPHIECVALLEKKIKPVAHP